MIATETEQLGQIALGTYGTLNAKKFSLNFKAWIEKTLTCKKAFEDYITEALIETPWARLEIDEEYLSLVIFDVPINWSTPLFVSKMDVVCPKGYYDSDAPNAEWIPMYDTTPFLINNFKDYAMEFMINNLDSADVLPEDLANAEIIL